MKKIISLFGEKTDIFEQLNMRAEKYAESIGFDYEWYPVQQFDSGEVANVLKDADAGIIDIDPYDEQIFKEIHGRNKMLVRFGVGYDKVDLKAASEYGIAIARTTGANTDGVAEMALSLMLAARRKLKLNAKCVKDGKWQKNVANEIINSTVGIMGFGMIGRRLAALLKGFGCRILAYDPFGDEKQAREQGVELVGFDQLLAESDAISIHVPLTKENYHMIGSDQLKLMKKEAVLVNTSRGGIIDEEALYQALSTGEIAGAALDVFEVEPLPVDAKLLTLDNFIATPHVSSQTEESLWSIYRMAIDIIAEFYEGKEPVHILNPEYKQQKV